MLVTSTGPLSCMERRNLPRINYKETRRYIRRSPASLDSTVAVEGMASEKVYGQLNGLIFQMRELMEDLEDLEYVSFEKMKSGADEMKALRVEIYSMNSELLALQGKAYNEETDKSVSESLVVSKKRLKEIELAISIAAAEEKKQDFLLKDQDQKIKVAEASSRRFAYETVLKELISLINLLVERYDIAGDAANLTKEIVLKRKEMKKSYSADYERIKVLIDRLLSFTDVVLDGKEVVINAQILKLSGLTESKLAFEEKLIQDLERFDLTDEKLKLATQTKVNIGKFSGSLEKGMDFYTFQSKFLRTYAQYPKGLRVEWLINNHLEGRAKECVGSLDDLEEIWNRLRNNFGNTDMLLEHQFTKVYQLGPMRNQKSYEQKRHFLQSLINSVQDVTDIATEHNLKGVLQFGDQLQKIVEMLDMHMQNNWYKGIAEDDVPKEQRWNRLLKFLGAELKIVQIRAVETGSSKGEKNPSNPAGKDSGAARSPGGANVSPGSVLITHENCRLCDEKHDNGGINFVLCKRFLKMGFRKRADLVRKKKCCFQCLDGQTGWRESNHKWKCTHKWVCRHDFHDTYDKKLHFLLCSRHAEDEKNRELYEEFKREVLIDEWQKELHASIYICRALSTDVAKKTDVAKEIDVTKKTDVAKTKKAVRFPDEGEEPVVSPTDFVPEPDDDGEYPDALEFGTPTYILQPVPFNDRIFSLLFDSACIGFVCRDSAVDALPDTHKQNTKPGPIFINGVGGAQAKSQRGEYAIKLPAYNNRLVKLTGLCLNMITGQLPPYPVREARKDVVKHYVDNVEGGKESDLPKVPLFVGGETDGLVGIQFNYFFPRLVHILPTGLAIYKSIFMGVDNTRGCIGGSHEIFSQCERQFFETTSNVVQFKAFLQRQVDLFNTGMRVCLDHDVFSQPENSQDDDSVEINGAERDDSCSSTYIAEDGNDHVTDNVLIVNTAGMQTEEMLREADVVQYENLYDIVVVDEDKPDITPLLMSVARVNRTENNTLKNNNTLTNNNNNYKCCKCQWCLDCREAVVLTVAKIKKADTVDNAGSCIEFRCPKCRMCSDCRKSESIEKISFKMEREQAIIDSSVIVDIEKKISIATLPFMYNPEEKLSSNRKIALKVYKGQVRKLAADPAAREAVILSEGKLQTAGYTNWCENLDPLVREQMKEGVVHYLPWRVVHNENSTTTPVRVVFDASAVTETGFAINHLLALGINSINSLLDIWLRWRIWPVVIHTDITKMYNVVKLMAKHWKYQLYLWEFYLDPANDARDKVITTVIYGMRSSGSQAQVALRRLAEILMEKFPEAAEAVLRDIYVDDCATGAVNVEKAEDLAANISELLSYGGFSVKGVTISGRAPLPALTKDGKSINVVGTKWYPEEDRIQLACGPLNFLKKVRGKKIKSDDSGKVPKKLTMKICASKNAEIFDISGIILPITASFKIDLHHLHLSSYSWEDELSDSDRETWIKHFDVMRQLDTLSWTRAVIPSDAVDMNMQLIGTGDASQDLACSACYVRFKRKDGSWSCQLFLAKSKIVSKDTTLPRAELLASTLNTHATEIARRSVEKFVTNIIYVLDSEIALYWIGSDTKPLKPYVRNRVIEIRRFTDIMQWFHVESSDNPVDIATRKGATLDDVSESSEWMKGKPWMRKPMEELHGEVLKDLHQVKLKTEQFTEISKESVKPDSDLCRSDFHLFVCNTEVPVMMTRESIKPTIRERLLFSKYLIDPNKFRFLTVVRILALVIKVAKNWIGCVRRKLVRFSPNFSVEKEYPPIPIVSKMAVLAANIEQPVPPLCVLSDLEIQCSLDYFFRKATEELKSYVHPKHYTEEAVERNGILYHAGRVMSEDISLHGDSITDKMIDLSQRSFIVPIVDSDSPLAYSIVNEVHWYGSSKHRGVETTIRATMTIAHILQVRKIAKVFRTNCQRCRYLLLRTVDVAMGPASGVQLCVAPPFYVTQCDLCGPFTSYSSHNKRATLKIWIAVYVCVTTGMTSLKVMEDYSTIQFLLSFERFADDLGFPKKLLIDEGSQLVCGCESVVLNMRNIKGRLNREFGVEFTTCPVGGHNYHGKVERKIKTVKETLCIDKVQKQRLSVLEWETTCSSIANSINNLPIAIGNEVEELENLDLITPNRLRLARNNERSPIGPLEVTGKLEKLMRLKTETFQAWWEAWLTSALPKLIPRPKWFRNDADIKEGDVVLFDKSEGSFVGDYQYGMVDSVKVGPDSKIRAVTVKYQNASENVSRTTFRAVRKLVVIHRVDEIDLMEELGEAAIDVTAYFLRMEFPS